MTADEFAKRLEKIDGEQAAADVSNACYERIAEIRQRIQQISPGHPVFGGNPPELQAAYLKGAAAVEKLTDEIRSLEVEQDRLAALAPMALARGEQVRLAALRRDIPAGLKRCPAEIKAVRSALNALDVTLEKLNATLHTIGSFGDVGLPFPQSDLEVQELLQLREEVWKVRNVALLMRVPAGNAKEMLEFLKANRLAYNFKGDGIRSELLYAIRYPPLPRPAFAQE